MKYKHKHPHHGGLPPPPAVRILQLDPIQRKPDADEGLGGGLWKRNKIIYIYSIIYKKLKCNAINNECDDHAFGWVRCKAHRPMKRIGGFM